MYDDLADIASVNGLEKDYRNFWNEKTLAMCNARAKLSRQSRSTWCIWCDQYIMDANLLEFKAEKLKCRICEAYPDEITAGRKVSSIEHA